MDINKRKDELKIVKIGIISAGFILLIFALMIARYVKTEKESVEIEKEISENDISVNEAKDLLKIEAVPSEIINEVLDDYENPAIVSCNSYINFRTNPSQINIGNIIGKLSDGAVCDVISMNVEGFDGWAHVKSGGMDGYVANSYLITGDEMKAMIPDLIKTRARVICNKLRIRSTPAIEDGNTVASAGQGEKYEIVGRPNDEWIEIKTDNIEGLDTAFMSSSPENVEIAPGLDEARTLNLRQKVLNMYDNLGVSKASDYVNIRKTPKDEGLKNIVGKFPGYAACNILSEENGYYKIKSGTVTGYVAKEYVVSGKEAEDLAVKNASLMAIVNVDSLNVRSKPDLDSKVWTKITKDQRYDVINQMDGWVQLDLDTGDDVDEEQGAYASTRDRNVEVCFALKEAIEYRPAVEAANKAMAFRNNVVNFGCKFVGNRYVWGGTSLTHGCDCSGFVQQVMRKHGISLPRTSRAQARCGQKTTSANMKAGDLLFYANRSGTVNHVAMYIGNGQIVHAASRRSGIKISRWNYRTPVAIRNVIGK